MPKTGLVVLMSAAHDDNAVFIQEMKYIFKYCTCKSNLKLSNVAASFTNKKKNHGKIKYCKAYNQKCTNKEVSGERGDWASLLRLQPWISGKRWMDINI